jgi:hypothetical protein
VKPTQADSELEEDPGLAETQLPDPEETSDSDATSYEKPRTKTYNTWNFVSPDDNEGETGVIPPSPATIPATDTVEATAGGVEPPG